MPPPLHLIVACAENRVIGQGGRLPWRIPEDYDFFLRETENRILILGRHCFESWSRVTLDGRRPVVITSRPSSALSNPGRASNDVLTAPNFSAALALADELAQKTATEIYVCGGERIYAEALALAGRRPLRLLLTLIHAEVPGDTSMPEWRHLPWQETHRRPSADANFRYTFSTLEHPAPEQTLPR